MKRKDYDTLFADRIIAQIKAGTAPWMKPWAPGVRSSPFNFTSENRYSGSNHIYLATVQADEGYETAAWGTFRQIKAAGGHVRKGEKSSPVVWWKFRKKVGEDDDGRPIYERLDYPWFRTFNVFNIAQADGIDDAPFKASATDSWDRHEVAEAIVQATGIPVVNISGDTANYNLRRDRIVLPLREQFEDADRYYGTLFHELAHGTGHPSRLNRETLIEGIKAGFGSTLYAREELRAEIAAMMIGDELGIGYSPDQQTSYVDGWLHALEEDPSEIRKASGEALRAATWITDQVTKEDEKAVAA